MTTKKAPTKQSAILVLRPDRNHKLSDYTGAFLPESTLFSRYHRRVGRKVIEHEINIDKGPVRRRREVLEAIRSWSESYVIDAVAFFCHGWPTGIQLGFRLAHVELLAKALAAANPTGNATTVSIYSCLTGKGPAHGDGNFADELRDALCVEGQIYGRTMGHATSGPAEQNPYVRLFDGNGSPVGGTGGNWIVRPGTAQWAKWRRAMKGGLRHRFPWMPVEKIHRYLETL